MMHRAIPSGITDDSRCRTIMPKDIDPERPQGRARAPGTTPTIRLGELRRHLAASGFVRVLEVHSPLCGLIAEAASAEHD
jgi:hypothetical protein